MPDETTFPRFRHLLEMHPLAEHLLRVVDDLLGGLGLLLRTGTALDATPIAAPRWTKNGEGKRDPEMPQSKKGKQWHFGMKAHIGVDVSRAWFTRFEARRERSPMSHKPTRFCTPKSV